MLTSPTTRSAGTRLSETERGYRPLTGSSLAPLPCERSERTREGAGG